MTKKILLASLGLFQGGKPYLENTYSLNGKLARNSYFFLALNELLGIEFDRIILFLTEASRKAYESDIRSKIPENLEIIDISDGKTIEEIWKLFDGVVEKGMECSDTDVYLDITNGFRHLPLVLYNSLFYLESLGKINVKGIYYGALESNRDANEVPVFDLTNLAKIIRGSFAVKEFEKTGHIIGVKNFANEILNALTRKEHEYAGKGGKINKVIKADQIDSKNKDEFGDLEKYVLNGLTFESGISANVLLQKITSYHSDIRAVDDLLKRLSAKLEPIAIKDSLAGKKSIKLDINELRRQLAFIRWHIDIGSVSSSLVLLREWMVNRTILANTKEHYGWVDYGELRKNIEFNLNELSHNYKNNNQIYENESFGELIEKWYHYSNSRNKYAHGGHRNESVDPKQDLDIAENRLYKFCLENIDDNSKWILPPLALLTPMGASFGLLYTALKRVNANRVVVLTSEKFKDKVSEVCIKAGFDADKVKVLTMQDVFCGFGEAKRLSSDMISAVKGTCNCIVNLTGGTTAMQWTMQTVYEELKQKNMSVKRIAFVDRRPSVEQQSNPFVEGELIDVESLI